MAVHYTCDECGSPIKRKHAATYKGKKYVMALDIGTTQQPTMYGTGICGAVDLCNRCKVEIIKELLNGK